MTRNKISIFGVEILNVTFEESAKILKEFLQENKLHTIVTPNTEIVMACKKR